MKVCIFGAGAIGGFLAAYLSKANNEVSLIARGSNLEAYKENGIKLYHGDRFVKAILYQVFLSVLGSLHQLHNLVPQIQQ